MFYFIGKPGEEPDFEKNAITMPFTGGQYGFRIFKEVGEELIFVPRNAPFIYFNLRTHEIRLATEFSSEGDPALIEMEKNFDSYTE